MKSAVHSRASRLALLMALILGLTMTLTALIPAMLLAAPLHQEAEPVIIGYYQSEVMPAGPDAQLQISLTLYDDQTAEVVSDYLEGEPPIVEIGTWEQNEDGSVTLTVTGTDTEPYEQPIVLTLELESDGSLSIPGVEGGAFGTEGLTLAPAEIPAEAAPAVTATVEITPTATVTAAAEITLPATVTAAREITLPSQVTATAEVTEAVEVTPTEEEPAAEEPAAEEREAEVYLSDLLPVEIGEGRQITLTVNVDGTVEMVTDEMDGEPPLVESGEWARSSGVLTVTLTADADGDYDEPVVYAFQEQEDGTLVLPGEEGGPFGSEGLTLTAVAQEPEGERAEDAAGVYASDILPAAREPGMIILAILYDDGEAQVSSYYLNGEPPIVEIGAWSATGDATVTITATGTLESDYETPTSAVFDVTEAGLVAGSVTLNRLPVAAPLEEAAEEPVEGAEAEPAEEPAAGEPAGEPSETPAPVEPTAQPATGIAGGAVFQSETLPAASSPGREITLSLLENGSAIMSTDYLNDEPAVTEFGEWVQNDDGTITLTLTEGPGGVYEEPVVITFALNDDGSISAVEYDEALFGTEGLELAPASGE